MLHVVLFQPEIPQNTGNIARTCVLTGSPLHIIGPAGFSLEDKMLKRAGLDYWEFLSFFYYDSMDEFIEKNNEPAVYCMTTKGQKWYHEVKYPNNCFLLFGKETAGLPENVRNQYRESCVRLPMIRHERARSLNLSNAVAITVYEVLRQHSFVGLV